MKIKNLFLLLALSLLSAVQAYSQEYVVIVDPGELYSTYTMSSDEWNALVSAVGYTKANEIKIASKEGVAWPTGIRKLDDRLAARETISQYTTQYLATISEDAHVLEINASENAYMPEGFRPAKTFYFIMGTSGFVLLEDLVEENVEATEAVESDSNGELMEIVDAAALCSTYDISEVSTAISYYTDELGLTADDFALLTRLSQETAWPSGMSSLSSRNTNRSKIYSYVSYFAGTWEDEGKSYTMVWVPQDENTHMDSNMRPTTSDGIFIIFQSEGVKFLYR